MSCLGTRGAGRFVRIGAAVLAAAAGFAVAVLVGAAVARSFSLHVKRQSSVVNQAGTVKHESIVVTPNGFAVYALTGDSMRHPKCTKSNGCFMFWPPVTVSSPHNLSKAPGIKGKLGVWHRNGRFQLTLAGHPLYRFARDHQKGRATGQGIQGFGGTWHVVTAASSPGGTVTMPTTTSTTTTTTTPCLYPPCY